ncbi:MAG: hypothetical protein K9J16_17120, partial [Melioribacteraceae bacterium]|nr:hypothetical protein [Melioribacteraceae bacterium]MCF8421011.1 hypothetical protein [Melioribacteraceae bacterium]
SNNEFQNFYMAKYLIFLNLQIVGTKGRFSNGKSGLIKTLFGDETFGYLTKLLLDIQSRRD